MKWILISAFLSLSLAGCVSKPVAMANIKTVAPDAPLAVGDCVVLEFEEGCLRPEPWRRTIDAEGYFPAPLGQRVKVVGKTLTEARELIASHYAERMIHRRKLRLMLMRCEEYDRKRLEIEQRVERAWKREMRKGRFNRNLSAAEECFPRHRRWIVECAGCHQRGCMPDAPKTRACQHIRDYFREIQLSGRGFCEECESATRFSN